ncbi:translocon-associated protein, alpha subunit [Aspergillus uvarum CBS 121591]|uniref:Translocon-associated protein, alpha subunit n=4 Tax=Aspergillus TaxID=5052 RepID=A0A319CN22_9EURO|nr:translocon-associated protein, alpha subunit [Aspergillus uvarum CBS 121591]XP_025533615.1 translocon-associated protein, alpha subunit [Aspergillus japonicus CBS 114.51]PYI21079.1 translocon-associated protein, alpha subunit [Aspergillus violaceofuscus CBS 115571]PYI33310.1 translocon-associated protein, alpha subunit [Aspergillus indologenus CBS 114.80]PYH85990.1 translocon-associated protein, alpha subunit [Aspergillus uvarum CBS 121591]RAH87721.1 translocon-associated protein, alpha sub
MARLGFLSLALLSVQALIGGGLAADAVEKEEAPQTPNLAVTAQAAFPASEFFGVKLVNGHPTQALITFANDEPNPVTVNFIGGSLWSIGEEENRIVRNLTAHRYSLEIPAGEQESVNFNFATEMHPQDLRLELASVISDIEGNVYTLYTYNGTVSVVEPETSIFDPQILFLYFFLLACFSGVVYFFYTVWIAPYFPQKRRAGKAPETTKKSTVPKKEEIPVEGPAVTSATTYNADWIPAHHINRPEARKVKGSSSRSKSRA